MLIQCFKQLAAVNLFKVLFPVWQFELNLLLKLVIYLNIYTCIEPIIALF